MPGPDILEGVPYVKVKDMKGGVINTKALHRTTREIHAQYARAALSKGDLLLSIRGTYGTVAVVPDELHGGNITQDSVRISPRSIVDPRYLLHALRSPDIQRFFKRVAKGVAVKGVNVGDVRVTPIALAPLPEQRRIVAKIEELTGRSRRACEALKSIPPLIEKFKQSVLAAAFRGDLTAEWREKHPDVEPASELLRRIRIERRRRWEEAELAKMKSAGKTPNDDRWRAKYKEPEPVHVAHLPELPGGWEWASLEAVTSATRVIRYGILMPGPDLQGGVPYVKVKDMKSGVLNVASLCRTTREMHEKFKGASLAPGDLLLAIRGSFGAVVEVPAELDGGNITQDSARIALLHGVDKLFLAGALRAPHAQAFFRTVAKGVAVRGVNIEDVRRTPIPVAPQQEQRLVVAAINTALNSIAAIKNDLCSAHVQATMLDQSVLAKAFRGELVPQDSNDEPTPQILGPTERST